MGKYSILVILLIISLLSCTTEPEFSNNIIELKEIDVSCTEAYFKISIGDTNPNQTVILQRNGKEILRYSAEIKDSLVIDSLLTESKEYLYRAIIKENNKKVTEYELSTRTLTPTSHDMEWTTYDIGIGNTDILYDVAILENGDVWAVGKVYVSDENGNYEDEIYNLIVLREDSLKFDRIKVLLRNSYYTIEITSIFNFMDNYFILTTPGGIMEGVYPSLDYISLVEKNLNVDNLKCYAKTEKNILIVGRYGSVVRFDGNSWLNIDTGLSNNVLDVYGNGTSESKIYCVGTKDKKNIILDADGENYVIENWEYNEIYSTWNNKGFPIYYAGLGVYQNKSGFWKKEEIGKTFMATRIRGTNLADIWIAGMGGLVAHYNGKNWHRYAEFDNYYNFFRSIAVTDKKVALVGVVDGKTVLIVGKKNSI